MIRKTCDRCGTGENVNWVLSPPGISSTSGAHQLRDRMLDACDSCWEEYRLLFDRWLERKMDDAES